MKFFFDTEFIEDGKTIDLISIGIVAEDGREYYAQNVECDFRKANDFVWRNVYPSLTHFDMNGRRSCTQARYYSLAEVYAHCNSGAREPSESCFWRSKSQMRGELREFIHPGITGIYAPAEPSKEEYPKPEFWAYYGSYDWVVLCQIFGTMMQLPPRWPMYVHDLKQLCDEKGNPDLSVVPNKGEHNALDDARWNMLTYKMLKEV